MSKIKLTGENSGYVEISAGQNAGNNTLETPTSGTRLVAHEGSQDVTLNANLTVNGVLTYDDVTNIDSVGVITARNGLHVTTGSVGIGTDAPGAKLEVRDSSSQGIIIRSGSTQATDTNKALRVRNNSDTNTFHVSHKGQGYFAGSVGINTTSPSRQLEVFDAAQGTIAIKSGDAGQSSLWLSDSDINVGGIYYEHNNNALGIRVNDSERLRITSDGKVGVNETAPAADLVVKQSGNTFTTQSQTVALFQRSSTTGHGAKIAIVAGTGGSSDINFGDTADEDIGIIQYFHTDNSFRFTTNTAEALRIASDGNTTLGYGGASLYFQNGFNNSTARIQNGGGSNNSNLKFYTRSSGTEAERLRITSDGIVDVTGKLRIDISNGGTAGSGAAEGIFLRNTQETDNNAVTIFGGADDYNAAASAINFINVDHSANAGDISFDTRSTSNSYAERLRITSTGQLLLGIDNAVASDVNFQIHSATSGVGPILNMTNNTGDCRIFFGQDNSSGGANAQGQIRYNVANNYLSVYAAGAERLRIDSSGFITQKFTSNNSTTAEGLFINNLNNGTGNNASLILSNDSGERKKAAIALIDTGSYGAGDLVFALDGADSGELHLTNDEKLRITSDGGINSGNITISGAQNTHNPDNYSTFVSDNHANTFFGLNLRLGYSSGSGNHQLVVNNQHAQIGGAGMLIGGNQSSYVNEIQFVNVSGNQTAGTRVDDTKRRLSIESSGRVVIHGNGTVRTSWPGAVCSVNNLAMMDAGSGFSWGLRANSGDTQWCLERIVGNNSFSDSNIKFRVYNNGNYMFAGSNSSDRDIKENIEDISGTSLNLIDQLRPRTFNFKESEGYSTEPKTGFVAQEIGAVIPSIVNGTDGQKDMGVDYNGLVAHLVKAVQELKAENDSLRSRLDTAGL